MRTACSSPCAVAAVAFLSFAPIACSSSPKGEPSIDVPALTPATGDVQAFSRLTNSIPITITVGGVSGWAFVDTGNPWALLDPTIFPSAAGLPVNGGTLPSITLASEIATNPYVIGSTGGDLQGDSTFSLDGNIGCTVVCGFTPSFNYRDVTVTLGGAPAPSGLEPAVTVPFSFKGGGTEEGLAVPRSRIVVAVSVEGNMYSMILDTGASDVTLSGGAFAALTSDGRTQVSGGTAETASGSSTSSITRAASIILGGVEVDNLVVAHDTSFDTNLATVSSDVGSTIDGSLGGTFLHEFYVTVDYTSQTVSFARYSDTSFVIDAGEHIGITLGTEQVGTVTEYGVAAASGDAAAIGVAEGDVIVAIDGQQLSSLSSLQVATLVFGAVGTTKSVTFGAATNLSGMTVSIPVEENLPLPAGVTP